MLRGRSRASRAAASALAATVLAALIAVTGAACSGSPGGSASTPVAPPSAAPGRPSSSSTAPSSDVEPSTTAASTAAPAVPAAVPGRVGRVAWQVRLPLLLSLVPAGAGVAVRTPTAVVGLDGPTGRVRWTWSRPGAVPAGLLGSPDRSTLVLRLDPAPATPALVVLDAGTGRVRFGVARTWSSGLLQLTDAAIVDSDAVAPDPRTGDVSRVRAPTRWSARSVVDGRLLWDHRVPAGCRSLPDDTQTATASFPTAATLVVATVCWTGPVPVPVPADQQTPATAHLTALDARTGRPRWERRLPVAGSTAGAAGLSVTVSRDGAETAVSWLDPQSRRTGLLVRSDTGAVLPGDPGDPAAAVRDGLRVATRARLTDATTGLAISAEPAVAECAAGGLALAAGVVCVDRLAGDPHAAPGRVAATATIGTGGLAGRVGILPSTSAVRSTPAAARTRRRRWTPRRCSRCPGRSSSPHCSTRSRVLPASSSGCAEDARGSERRDVRLLGAHGVGGRTQGRRLGVVEGGLHDPADPAAPDLGRRPDAKSTSLGNLRATLEKPEKEAEAPIIGCDQFVRNLDGLPCQVDREERSRFRDVEHD